MKTLKTERGQSLVELSISLLVLLFLLAGAVEFGLAFFQFVQLRDAAQEGALFGSMDPEAAIESRVRGSSSSPVDLEQNDPGLPGYVDVQIAATERGTGNAKTLADACEGDALTVTVSYDHMLFMPFIPQILNSDRIPLEAVVTDTVLSPVC